MSSESNALALDIWLRLNMSTEAILPLSLTIFGIVRDHPTLETDHIANVIYVKALGNH
jgi:hypothetical protein